MRGRPVTVFLAILTLAVLAISMPVSLHDALERGGLYLFSQAFVEDMPRRFTGPGAFRFYLQPLLAMIVGIRGGLADAREGKPPYLHGLLFHGGLRKHLLRSGFEHVVNLLLMGILLDSLFQWLIYGVSHAGAAVVVGPALIVAPYVLARGISNRLARLCR